ncbi:transketolase [Prosthecochloris sp. N3]|uniref:Transketolase n=1 Tax=Prosthecochloris ethylica TaxID=2743976 RepID=A0ABR9XQD3_9CHLB|nr:transketolase [Prosthecochloris ethylica]MBF0585398.1 transketolase [Prosthecochloris ethylica]MBF0636184.1 transketolase [Prosthecochloris ethylica]MEC9487026.1 transketolase [Prosthecochloris sp.]NUK46627.1 transketolase [Prosthecochloris ethylica]
MAKDLQPYPQEKKGEIISLDTVEELQEMARQVRRDVVRMLNQAASGHTGGSLGMADVFTTLYFKILRHDPHNFWDRPDQDLVFLSNGHIVPVWYSVLARCGYFPLEELGSLRRIDSYLQGHPASDASLPGIRIASGSLGQGLSAAVGAAVGLKMDGRDNEVFCLMGDGECQEGQIWEAAMSAAHYKLDHLVGIVDYNRLQIDGDVCDVMCIEPFADKWKAFGWNVYHCDGHDIGALIQTIESIRESKGSGVPSVILAETVMGKGVPFFEGVMPDNTNWHGKPPSDDHCEQALDILGQTSYGDY